MRNWIIVVWALLYFVGNQQPAVAQPVETGYNNSFVVPIELPITGARSAPVGVFVEDIDQNGEKDILLIRDLESRIYYQNDNNFTRTLIPNPFIGGRRINRMMDFNQDGVLDYLATDFSYLISDGTNGYKVLAADFFRLLGDSDYPKNPFQSMYFYKQGTLFSAHLIQEGAINQISGFQYLGSKKYVVVFNHSDPQKFGIEQYIYAFELGDQIEFNTLPDNLNQSFVPEFYVFNEAFGPIIYNFMFTLYSFSDDGYIFPSLPSKPIDLKFINGAVSSTQTKRLDLDSNGTQELIFEDRIYDISQSLISASGRISLKSENLRDIDSDGLVDFITYASSSSTVANIISFHEYNATTKSFLKISTINDVDSFPLNSFYDEIPDIAVNANEITYLSNKINAKGGIFFGQYFYSNGFTTKTVRLNNNTLERTNVFEVLEVYPGNDVFTSTQEIYPFRLTIADVNSDGRKDLVIATSGMTGGKQAAPVIQIYYSPEKLVGNSFYLY